MKHCRETAPELSAEETAIRLECILETAVDAIVTINDRGIIEMFNRAAEDMFGYEASEVIGKNVSILMPETHAARHDDYVRGHDAARGPRVIGRRREISALRRDGTEFPIELALSSVTVKGRRVFTGMIRDISRRRAAENEVLRYRDHLEQMVTDRTAALERTKDALRQANVRLEEMVRVDELTRVGNRRGFDERLVLEWRRQGRNGNPLAVVLCDVDHFKVYNDYYGHPAGDECLREIASALRGCFQRATDYVARYGGEEFAVILANTTLAAAAEQAETMRATIHSLAVEHAGVGAGSFITVSAGVAACVPQPSLSIDQLINAADAALYSAKEGGRNRVETEFLKIAAADCA